MTGDWRERCVTAGIDPELIGRIASRYRAYASHTAGCPDVLELAEWFRWYAVENGSQMTVDQVRVEDCSVDGAAAPVTRVDRSTEILNVLRLCLEAPR